MILLSLSAVVVFLRHSREESAITICNLKVCHLANPIGMDQNTPTFSWQMQGTERNLSQSAYRIMTAGSQKDLEDGNYLWDSGKITGSSSVGIPYEGAALAPKNRYYWQVTVWNEKDKPFTSEEEAFFETGLMGGGMEGAMWISSPEDQTAKSYEEDDFIYSIHYDLEITNSAASFVFGAENGRYGDMYLCKIYNQEEQALFTLQKMIKGFVDEEEAVITTDITACRTENDSFFAVDLQIDHESLLVTINNAEINHYEIDKTPVAAVGAYKSRGTSYAYLDNLLIQNAAGNILYKEDFTEEENIFSPYHTTVENERLKIGSGLLLTEYNEKPAPLFYREFSLQNKEIEDARIYLTALGSFSLICNGQKISDEYFAPGKLVYNRELTYATYDVTPFLHPGRDNALGITLLHGWYDRAVGYPEIWNPWGDKNALLGLLEIRYQDGTVQTIITDENFLCNTDSPIRYDDIYQGEFYDATLEQDGFGDVDFACENWQPSETNAIDSAYLSMPLTGRINEPVRCIEELAPLSVSVPRENTFVYDFGQNFAGTCRIKVTGNAGQILTLRYGEALNTETLSNRDDIAGTIWTENLLTADATDYYVLSGDPEGEYFEPEFTYHGFRYLQIEGLKEPLPLEDVKGIVLSSDLKQTGAFECSNQLLNQYYENTIWSQKSNFMDNPTDCPQRDERHGWAGDAQIYSLAASYHMDTYNFYKKYLNELKLLQTEGGSFPDMASRNFATDWDGRSRNAINNCWGDAAMVITWNLYTQYGDLSILRENYDSLCRWMDILIDTSDDYIRNVGGYGDHLSLESTPADLSDTAWCAHSAELLSKMAAALDKQEDSEYYKQIYECYKTAWQNAYVLEDGVTVCDTQTSYVLGLAFDLFPEDLKEQATDRLNLLAQYSAYHIHTGFSGIGYLLPALSMQNCTETAYTFLLQEEFPSLLYPAAHGATTVYEQLTGYTENEDGTYHLDGSLNHYAFGTPVSWIYTNVLGIKSDEKNPGFHHILLEPEVSNKLTYAKGSYESIYGSIYMAWEQMDNGYSFTITIPPNTSAALILPSPGEGMTYLESGKQVEKAEGVEYLGEENGKSKFELGSGSYFFTAAQMQGR